ncbi:MAG: hypothetical protein ACI9P5_003259 [Saprospiraceae bacterium]|jgi:hypothetical protein
MKKNLNFTTQFFINFTFILISVLFTNNLHAQQTGQSLDFDGIDDYVQLSGTNDFGSPANFSGDFTFEAWVLNDSSNPYGRIFDFGNSSLDFIFFTPENESGVCRFWFRKVGGPNSFTDYVLDGPVFPAGWTHVVCRLASDGTASIVINGVLAAAVGSWPPIANINGATTNYLGKSRYPDPYFNGKMKEVRVWNVHRTEAQINQWMNCELSGDEANLTAYHKMNQGIDGANNNGNDFQVNNFGHLSNYGSIFHNFALNGTTSNWTADAPVSFDVSATNRNAIEFYSNPDNITLNNEANFDFDEEFSIQYWHNTTLGFPISQFNFIKSSSTSPAVNFYTATVQDGVHFGINNSSGDIKFIEAYGLPHDKWAHITHTAKEENGGVMLRTYFNGVKQVESFTANYELPQTDNQVMIGVGNFHGKLANIKFWDRALEPGEINAEYGSIHPPGTPNLVAQYTDYDNNILNGLIDNIGGNDGVRSGVPVFITDPCFVQFTQEPQDTVLANFGTSITLTADFENCADPGYAHQWQFNGVDIVGETSLTLIKSNIQASDLGIYKCIVTACNQTFPTRGALVSIANQGKVLHFDGVDDYVTYSFTTGQEGQYSIEARVRFDRLPLNQNIISNSSLDFEIPDRQLAISDDGFFQHNAYDLSLGSMRSIKHPLKIEAHKWYNVEIHYDGAHMWLTVDGVVGPQLERTGLTANFPLWNIGKSFLSFDAFQGEIDEVRVWDISTSTINDQPELVGSSGNLKFYFQFNEGIAEANNASPILVNSLTDPFFATVATLHNFDLNGNQSNWLGCDTYDGDIVINPPANKIVTTGNALVLDPSVDNIDGTEIYQWYLDGVPIDGAIDQNYSITNTTPADQGSYQLEVGRFNSCKTFSDAIEVTIKGTGEVLNFDGVDDYIKIPSGSPHFYTVEMWVKFEDDFALQSLIVGSDNFNTTEVHTNQLLTDADGYLIHRTFTNTIHEIQSLAPVVPNQWYHVAIKAGDQMPVEMLIDGVLQGSVPNSGDLWQGSVPNNDPLWNGQQAWFLGSKTKVIMSSSDTYNLGYFKGEMDELRIWNTMRSDSLIVAHKDSELNNTGQAGLDFYFRFNQGLANGNNVDLVSSIQLPDYKNQSSLVPSLTDVKMSGFAFEGETSNYSDCSPISNPELEYTLDTLNGPALHIGQALNFNLEITTGDTSEIDFQWILDDQPIVGANEPFYSVESTTMDDFGQYKLAISDMCDPQYLDTLLVTGSPDTNFCFIDIANPTNYPDSTKYVFCNSATDGSGLCVGPSTVSGFLISRGYCGINDIEYKGAEVVMHIPLLTSQVVDLTLSNIQADVDMFLFSSDCNVDNCFGSSTNLQSNSEFIRAALPAGDYYLVIDEKQLFESTAGNDSLILDIEMYDNKCSFAIPIACGDAISGDTNAGSNFIDQYCDSNGYSSLEQVYEIVLNSPQTITAALSNLSADLDLFLLDSLCNEINCLASSKLNGTLEESLIYGVQPGTYYIVVDGKDGAEGTFDLSVSCAPYFMATIDETDAWIDLDWSIDKKVCVPQDTGIIVRLITTPNTILYEEEYNTAALTPDVITGTFRHLVGDNHSRQYVLRVYNRLSNKTLCNEVKMGSTLPFQQPEIISISQAESPDSIKLVWRNHSQLSDEFRIHRDGNQIINLIDGYTEDSLIVTYIDRHNIDNESSIDQASTYNYCIETFNTTLNLAYAQVCGQGTTYDVDFAATDGTPSDKIALTWNDISAFSDGIIIRRNGIQLEILSPNETFYNDLTPIYGTTASYEIALLRNGQEFIRIQDDGYSEPNGMVSGRVITAEGSYPVQQASVSLSKDTLIQNVLTSVEIANTVTDFAGKFIFEDVVYGLSADFLVSVEKAGSDITPNSLTFELNGALPVKTDLLFIDNADIIVSEVDSLLISVTSEVKEAEDLVIIHWDYDYQLNDTTYLTVQRNGELIFEAHDAEGRIDSLIDMSGVPGFNYTYTLEVFRYIGEDVINEIQSIQSVYPLLTPLAGWDYGLAGQFQSSSNEQVDPTILFDWNNYNHPSQNFDGYRIFRNNLLIGEIPKDSNEMLFYVGIPDQEAGYEMRTFRKINGATYESSPYPLVDSLITTNNIWKPAVLVDPISDRAIVVDIDTTSTVSDFYKNAIYTGVLLARKVQTEDDTTYVEIGKLTKDFLVAQATSKSHPLFWDAFGIPNESYTYRLSTYLDINGARYSRDTVFNRVCPEIIPPSNIQKIEEVGKVELTWIDNSLSEGLINQLYVNYEGYELTRRDITNGGTAQLIATLSQKTDNYDDYLSNPIFNLFLDDYVTTDYEYSLRAYFDIDTTRYYSVPLNLNAKPLNGDINEPLPTNFTASKDIPGHIKLCWEWNATKPSEFIIYRDTVAIDTMPTTARAYYDYDAPSDPSVLYKVTSIHSGNESEYVLAEGRMPANMRITGRISNFYTGVGLEGVNIFYTNLEGPGITAGEFQGVTDSDLSGNYYFDDIPKTPGYEYQVKAFSNNVDFNADENLYESFDSASITIAISNEYIVDFLEYTNVPNGESVSPIQHVSANADFDSMFVSIKWSPSHGNYDGFQIFRTNQLIGEVTKGNGFEFKDLNGFPGINYIYLVRAYKTGEGGRVYSEKVAASAVFPSILPVENLTVTAFAEMNRMLVSWSHPLDNHDTYRVRRNGQFMTSIPTGDVLMWYDSTGIPGLEYQYEVTAINGPNISVPVVVTKDYKGVGEARNLQVQVNEFVQACSYALTNDNHVTISWEYTPEAADGFEIYRDGELVAEIGGTQLVYGNPPLVLGTTLMTGTNATFDDYEGLPGTLHTYHVLPYVTREGDRYLSGVEELFLTKSITFPDISETISLDVAQNNVFGSVQINFSYPPYIVNGFEILRDAMPIDTVIETNEGLYIYQDFTGIPGQDYTYAVRAYDLRDNTVYLGSTTCVELVNFPIVPTPQNLTASQGAFENHIEVTWDFSLDAFVDSFYLENLTLNTSTTLGSGRRNLTETVNNFDTDKYEYRIRASRITENQTIYSEWSEVVEGWSSRQVTGNEDEQLGDETLTSRNGYSMDIDGDWAVSGAPAGLEQIVIYHREDGGWRKYETVKSPWGNVDVNFGFSVAISGNTIVVGVAHGDVDTDGAILIYEFDGISWGNFPQIHYSPSPGEFGRSVDIDGDNIVVSNPLYVSTDNVYRGALYWYERLSNGRWEFTNSIEIEGPSSIAPNITYLGMGLAIQGDYVLATEYSGIGKTLAFAKQENGLWSFTHDFNLNFTYHGEVLRDHLEYKDNVVGLGDPHHNGSTGKVRITETIDNINQTSSLIDILGDAGQSYFGSGCSVTKIPSPIDDAIYVAVGAPLYHINGQLQAGISRLYSNVTGSFSLVEEIEKDAPEADDLNGFSVALSHDAWGAGIIHDNEIKTGSVILKNLIKAPSSVVATEGISLDFDPTETTISWEFDGNVDLLAGFNIYRDEEFLTYRDKATATQIDPITIADSWNDNSGIAGLKYVYSVTSVNNLIPFESYGTSDEGYNRADGRIIGAVRTQMGSAAVPGVTITATGIVKGEVYTYTTTTLANGEYTFNEIYYSSDPDDVTTYELNGEYLDHIIIPQVSSSALLNPLNDPTQAVVDFYDVTAYVIRGVIAQPDVDCPLEGIEVIQIINGQPELGLPATTDENGAYTLVINPFDPDLQEIRVRINQSFTEDDQTTVYGFSPDSDTIITDFSNIPIITELNFNDTLSYNVNLKVKNTCNDAISTGKWNVRVRTLDGCFDQQYATNSNGDLFLDLIPLNYTMQVVGVDVPTSQNQQALDYFSNFPVSLHLLDLHQDSIETNSKEQIEGLAGRQFTFHTAPTIEVEGLDDLICETQTAILDQAKTYTLSFDIAEVHNGTNCPVEEGRIVVINPAAVNTNPIVLVYDEVLETFPDYTFIAGNPNQIFPHAYAITFDYQSLDGDFLGRLTRAAFVQGSIALPGTDIIVDPASGNDAVPYPLLVLRDPPGDQSFSYIAAEQTIGWETEFSKETELNGSLYTEINTEIFGTGTDIGFSLNSGFTKAQTIVTSAEVTTSATITTSDDEDNIGRGADVIVGTGLVMQFGLINKFKVEEGVCNQITKETLYGISPNTATTTWSYQVSQIEDIIQGYINDSIRVEEGTLTVLRGGNPLTQQEARVYLNSNIDNWKEVLIYHDEKTVPHYHLMTLNPTVILPTLFGPDLLGPLYTEAIEIWQAQMRPFFVDLVNGKYVLKEDIIWDSQLISLYNLGAVAIRELKKGGSQANLNAWKFPYVGANNVDLMIPLGSFNLVDFQSIENSPLFTDFLSTFGDPVKNITTGGNVLTEVSINNVSSSETSSSFSSYIGTELDVALTFGGSSEIIIGGFAGLGGGVIFGSVLEVFSTEVKIGAKLDFKASFSNSSSNSVESAVEVGYTIFDDDNIDQLSVAAIQGVAQNMTPYFDFFGGRSSCPPEDGSIFVDAPRIAILDLESGGTSQTKSLFNVPEDEPAEYYVIVENQSPVSSQPDRELEVYLESGSNDNGAVVKINGVSLNNGTYIDSFSVGEPDTLILTIERGPTSYDYPDIQIGFEPTCGEGPREYIYASAYFVNPCSPVTLVAPNQNWVINDDTSKLVVAMQDYDPENPFLVDATVQYRRLGTGMDWTDVPGLQLEKGNFISADSLASNDAEYAEGQIPKYFFIWTVPTGEGLFPDGDYEVRTKMVCDNFSSTISNVIAGKIARNGLNLFGNPQPADQLWTVGDEISFTFNKDLDCALITETFIENNISVFNETTQTEEPFTLSCYANKVIFVMDSLMSNYDGQFLTINVDNIPSLEGNISLPHSWTFRVITQKIYWADSDTIKLRMYQDDIQNLTIDLENSTLNETITELTFEAEDGGFGDWLTIIDPIDQPFEVTPSGRIITFEVDASEPVGIYNETVNVLGVESFGNTPQVHIQLEVIVKPPKWEVDPADFENSMNMIANWRYDTDTIGSITTDDADLISVWVGNEIRGVASITQSGEFFASYLTIYGNAEDGSDTELEFRVWDADLGIEYDGQPSDSIFYIANSTRGTTANPEILIVNAEYDRAKYIYFNQGWTGFSLSDSTINMDVMHKLRTLGSVTEGDMIVTGDKFSQYTDSLGWFNFGASNLEIIDNDEGYMIYLENGPDTLRVTGISPTAGDLTLKSGWNWLGFPFENSEALNDVLDLNTENATGEDRIKLDFPLAGDDDKFANYNIVSDNWNDGNITNLEPYNLYKFYSGHPNGAILSWGPQNNLKGKIIEDDQVRSSEVVDPDNAGTWVMPDFATDQVMPIIAEVIVGGVVANDPADMVAFFENDTIRALANIEEVSALNIFALSMLAEKTIPMSAYDIRYYDASEGVVLTSTDTLTFNNNGVGDVFNPYELIFEEDPCPETLLLGPSGSPFVLDKTFEASAEIRVLGTLNVPDGVNIILSAPKVTIVDMLNTANGATVTVRPDGCN